MLSREKAKSVLATAERHLLTPYGLRSLAPSDPQYRGRYEGNSWSRDSAYHQGTVWPWLMGPFITAYIKVNGRSSNRMLKKSQPALPVETKERLHVSAYARNRYPAEFDVQLPVTKVSELVGRGLESVLSCGITECDFLCCQEQRL